MAAGPCDRCSPVDRGERQALAGEPPVAHRWMRLWRWSFGRAQAAGFHLGEDFFDGFQWLGGFRFEAVGDLRILGGRIGAHEEELILVGAALQPKVVDFEFVEPLDGVLPGQRGGCVRKDARRTGAALAAGFEADLFDIRLSGAFVLGGAGEISRNGVADLLHGSILGGGGPGGGLSGFLTEREPAGRSRGRDDCGRAVKAIKIAGAGIGIRVGSFGGFRASASGPGDVAFEIGLARIVGEIEAVLGDQLLSAGRIAEGGGRSAAVGGGFAPGFVAEGRGYCRGEVGDPEDGEHRDGENGNQQEQRRETGTHGLPNLRVGSLAPRWPAQTSMSVAAWPPGLFPTILCGRNCRRRTSGRRNLGDRPEFDKPSFVSFSVSGSG